MSKPDPEAAKKELAWHQQLHEIVHDDNLDEFRKLFSDTEIGRRKMEFFPGSLNMNNDSHAKLIMQRMRKQFKEGEAFRRSVKSEGLPVGPTEIIALIASLTPDAVLIGEAQLNRKRGKES